MKNVFGRNRKWNAPLKIYEKTMLDRLKRKIADERGCDVGDVSYSDAVQYLLNEYQFRNEI